MYIYLFIILLLLFMRQQLVTGAAQPGAGLLATGMVPRSSGMRVLEWHEKYKITENDGVEVAYRHLGIS